MANSGVFVSCGPMSPDHFGANGELVCRVSAPNDRPPVVSVERSVQFSESADTRPLTVIDLVEQ